MKRPKILILLTGPMRAGKDTVGEELCRAGMGLGYNTARCALADGVKEELAQYTGVPVSRQSREDWRHVWQFWATEVRREKCGKAYWIRRWEERATRLLQEGADMIIVTDVRFTNEPVHMAQWAAGQEMGMAVVRVTRGWRGWRPWDLRRWHGSEREWQSIPCDHRIVNNGSISELWIKARKVLDCIVARSNHVWTRLLHRWRWDEGMGKTKKWTP